MWTQTHKQSQGPMITNAVTWSAGRCVYIHCCSTHRLMITLHESVIIPHTHQPLCKHRQPKCWGALLRSTSAEWFNSQARSSNLFQLQLWVLLSKEGLAFGRWQMDLGMSETWVQHPGRWTLTNPEDKSRGRSHLTALPFKWPAACLPVVTQSLMTTPSCTV